MQTFSLVIENAMFFLIKLVNFEVRIFGISTRRVAVSTVTSSSKQMKRNFFSLSVFFIYIWIFGYLLLQSSSIVKERSKFDNFTTSDGFMILRQIFYIQ